MFLSQYSALASQHARIHNTLVQSALLIGLAGGILHLSTSKLCWLWTHDRFISSNRRNKRDRAGLENWIRFQRGYCFKSLVGAFGPKGFNAPGTRAGVMIASPSRPGSYDDPRTENYNYFFHWIRDSSLCLRVILRILDEIEIGRFDELNHEDDLKVTDWLEELSLIVLQTIELNSNIQSELNLCGGPIDGGLGEPKFLIDGSRFDEPWGRPQNDGPAIRASTMIRYATHLIKDRSDPQHGLDYLQSSNLFVNTSSRSQIRLDIDHVCRTWRKPTFDLWEEVKADNGGHFYTLMVQRKSIQDFLDLMNLLPNSIRLVESELKKYETCLEEMDKRLEDFWNPKGLSDREGGPAHNTSSQYLPHLTFSNEPHILPTLDRLAGQPKPSQIDTSVILAINHTAGPNQPQQWSPTSDRVLSTLHRLIDAFEKIYPINQNKNGRGIAFGRYPEDEYDGIHGNSIAHPWFLCTHAIIETIYLAINQFRNQSEIIINDLNRPFFSRFLDSQYFLNQICFKRGDKRFCDLLKSMILWSDQILIEVSWKNSLNGKMSEQIDRKSGEMRGARELTWSYASFLTAISARENQAPN